jgi:hypothetical protein
VAFETLADGLVGQTPSFSLPPVTFGHAIAYTEARERYAKMLYTIALILLILWVLGMVTSYTVGGLIHILLVLAIVSVLIRVIQGRAV